jgi:hypothetical protein
MVNRRTRTNKTRKTRKSRKTLNRRIRGGANKHSNANAEKPQTTAEKRNAEKRRDISDRFEKRKPGGIRRDEIEWSEEYDRTHKPTQTNAQRREDISHRFENKTPGGIGITPYEKAWSEEYDMTHKPTQTTS